MWNLYFCVSVFLALALPISTQSIPCTSPCLYCPAFIRDANYKYYPNINDITSGLVECSYVTSSTGNVEISYQSYTCPSGFIFSPRISPDDQSPLCAVAKNVAPTNPCNGVNQGNVTCFGIPSLYCTCQNGQITFLNQCDYGKSFNNQTRVCELKCQKAGIFGYSNITEYATLSNYYTCVFNNKYWNYDMTLYECPQNTVFNSTYSLCLAQENNG